MNAGILRGLGDSKASLWFLVVSCVSNIVFDLLFVRSVAGDDSTFIIFEKTTKK